MSVVDWINNRDIRKISGISRSLLEHVDQIVLKWFGHEERMDEEKLTVKV